MEPNHLIQRAKVNQNSWKLALTKQVLNLEDSLAQVYIIAGQKYIRVVTQDVNDETALLEEPKGLGKSEINSYEKVITECLNDINRSVTIICNLISCDAEFDLPIPVVVLLRLASKVGQLRWLDFSRKIPGTTAKKHVYNKTSLSMIQTSLTMFRWISSTLATDILPFQSFINDYNLNLLEWTRASHLEKHDKQQYYWIRSLVFSGITWELAQFSLNISYDDEQLKKLIGVEIADEISKVPPQDDYAVEKYIHDALDCLEWLFITYSKWLDAQLEFKLKNFILHTCLDIYRNFEKNTISLNCRRQLLRVLVTIANQPFATSTTELAWHIIEQASRLETDLEIVLLTRKAMDLGLAHRPSIIPSREYYSLTLNSAAQLLEPIALTNGVNSHSHSDVESEPEKSGPNIEPEPVAKPQAGSSSVNTTISDPQPVIDNIADSVPRPEASKQVENGVSIEEKTHKESVSPSRVALTASNKESQQGEESTSCPLIQPKPSWLSNLKAISQEEASAPEPEPLPALAIDSEVANIAELFVDEPAK